MFNTLKNLLGIGFVSDAKKARKATDLFLHRRQKIRLKNCKREIKEAVSEGRHHLILCLIEGDENIVNFLKDSGYKIEKTNDNPESHYYTVEW